MDLELKDPLMGGAPVFSRLEQVWRFDSEWTQQLDSVINGEQLWESLEHYNASKGRPSDLSAHREKLGSQSNPIYINLRYSHAGGRTQEGSRH